MATISCLDFFALRYFQYKDNNHFLKFVKKKKQSFSKLCSLIAWSNHLIILLT